ncbi:MAG: signal peptidase I [Erysipelotrichaceae bacterium]|nr:signal peptidase I [Erysipelotrichaceae bacterium]
MKFKSFIIELLKTVLTSIVIVFVLVHFILMPCMVQGSSMYPYLQNGDYGFSFIISKNLGIRRFDVAVIDIPDAEDKLLVKRVIGLPNEKITFIENKLYVNDEYVEEPFLSEDTLTKDFEVVLGEDEYFCMGDNRSVSRDSRYYGAFSRKDILSTKLFVIYPFKDFGMH